MKGPKPWNEVRLDERGEPDDIALDGIDLHLERMGDDTWWLAAYRGDRRICFWLQSAAIISLSVGENSLQPTMIPTKHDPD